MGTIFRKYIHAEGEFIEAHELNEEFDQLIATTNLKVEPDGTLWDDLWAEGLHDGVTQYAVSAAGGTNKVPVCIPGTIQVGLNADLLDGYHSSDLTAGAFQTNTTMLFYQQYAPSGWQLVPPGGYHRHFGWMAGKTGGTQTAAGAASEWDNVFLSVFNVTVNGHVLTESELPIHSHDPPGGLSGVYYVTQKSGPSNGGLVTHTGNEYLTSSGISTETTSTSPPDAGSDQPHSHTTTLSFSGGSWVPPTSWCIVCLKT